MATQQKAGTDRAGTPPIRAHETPAGVPLGAQARKVRDELERSLRLGTEAADTTRRRSSGTP